MGFSRFLRRLFNLLFSSSDTISSIAFGGIYQCGLVGGIEKKSGSDSVLASSGVSKRRLGMKRIFARRSGVKFQILERNSQVLLKRSRLCLQNATQSVTLIYIERT